MKSDKDKRLVRLLRIVIILGQGSFNAKRFAQEENCSWRTIQRDIVALECAGFPLYKQYNGYWKLDESFKLFSCKYFKSSK